MHFSFWPRARHGIRTNIVGVAQHSGPIRVGLSSAWRSAPGLRHHPRSGKDALSLRISPQLHWQTASLALPPQSRLAKA